MPDLNVDRLIFFVGLNTGYVTGGTPDSRMIEFYERRSSAALHSVIVGNAVIPGGVGTNPNTPVISNHPEWTELAQAIARRGCIPGIQLATVWEGYKGAKTFRAADTRIGIDTAREIASRTVGRAMISLLDNLKTASDLALKAGYRHIQIHAAHGYLFSLLIDDRINKQAAEVLYHLNAWAVNQSALGIETSIRISLRTGDTTFDQTDRERFLGQISSLDFQFIDLSSGFYDIDKRLIYPGRPDVLRQRLADTIALARTFPDKRFIYSGRALLSPISDLPPNVHLGLCRDLLANPDYLSEKDRGCRNSGKCHYFSRGEGHISCSRWHPDGQTAGTASRF